MLGFKSFFVFVFFVFMCPCLCFGSDDNMQLPLNGVATSNVPTNFDIQKVEVQDSGEDLTATSNDIGTLLHQNTEPDGRGGKEACKATCAVMAFIFILALD